MHTTYPHALRGRATAFSTRPWSRFPKTFNSLWTPLGPAHGLGDSFTPGAKTQTPGEAQ